MYMMLRAVARESRLALRGQVWRVRRALGGVTVLTRRQRRQFRRDGYLVIDTHIPDAVLEKVKADMDGRYQRWPEGIPGYPFTGRVQDGWKFSDAARTLVLWPRVLRILEELYGRNPLPFQSLNFPAGTEQEIHSDTIHFNSNPAGWMCGVWHALEDIDEDCGPVMYYPGSHRLPEYTLEHVGAKVVVESYDSYPKYEEFIANLIRRHRLTPRLAVLKKGQAFIWAANLLHGGGPRRDPNRSRHSQVNHYFFEGCRYYTPLYSTRERVYWRNPSWVT